MGMLLTLLFTCVTFFGLPWTEQLFKPPCTASAFFLERLSNYCQGLRHTFSWDLHNIDAVPLPDPSRNRIRIDTRFQIKGRKNQHVYPAELRLRYKAKLVNAV
jgi:hypothetical protein